MAGQFETTITKLVQCQLYWTALNKVGDDKFVRLRSRLPTSVKIIDANHVRCSNNSLDAHCRFPDIADDYERKTRMPMADLRATITAVDNAYAFLNPKEKLHTFACVGHIEAKVADCFFKEYHNVKQGVLHAMLAMVWRLAITVQEIAESCPSA